MLPVCLTLSHLERSASAWAWAATASAAMCARSSTGPVTPSVFNWTHCFTMSIVSSESFCPVCCGRRVCSLPSRAACCRASSRFAMNPNARACLPRTSKKSCRFVMPRTAPVRGASTGGFALAGIGTANHTRNLRPPLVARPSPPRPP